MTVVTALMYAFNSLLFQNDLAEYFEVEVMMKMMIGFATFFIVLIVAWLINYMVKFMLEKRSTEFGIYLLIGMKKKTVSRLYMRENILLGLAAFVSGCLLGILFQQILMAIMYAMLQVDYRITVSFSGWTIFMTVVCYFGCFWLALLRCKRKFRKMNIHDLMNAKRRNEEIREKREEWKRLLFPLSILFIFAFWMLFRRLSDTLEIILFLTGLVLTIYLFYVGISAWIICYVRKKGKGIYRGQNLFLFRQFASKVRSMQFTMGTLTALFTLALLGASIAWMFSDYENTVLMDKFPFDVQIYSSDVSDDFSDEIRVLRENTEILDLYSYHIYTDKGSQVNTWMLTNLTAWGTMYQNEDGTPDTAKIEEELKNGRNYCTYDTYMGISDYNYLRDMLGYQEISLSPEEYLVHTKSRISDEVQGIGDDLQIADASGNGTLICKGIFTEPFSQDGHNGGDYIIVVPDEVLTRMQPYYSELVADINGDAPMDLRTKLDELTDADDFYFGDRVDPALEGNSCTGSDNIITYSAVNLVKDNLIPEVKYMLASIIIPLFYIGMVFLCIAMTVLSVQQISDSAKYKFRYDVLKKLGLERTRIDALILKQLGAYYLCPALLAIVISGEMIQYMSKNFVIMTGVPVSSGAFFARSVLLFFGIYLVYFVVTYIEFKRNIESKITVIAS
jgi:hypothetical protein